MSLKRGRAILFVIVVLITVSMVLKNELLHIVSRVYFDEQYYLKSYPEVATLKVSPFEHYSTIGWREGKNPNADMDNNFYIRVNEGWDKFMFWLNPLEHSALCKLISNDCYTSPKDLKKVELLKNSKYYLTIVSLFRDEARFLKEWIEFYKLMGVEHFYLYNHLSKDNYMEVLKPYIEDGTVELENVTIEPENKAKWYNDVHFKVYNEVIKKAKDNAEWIIVVDSDEFLFPVQGEDLKSILKKYDDYPSVSVNWKLFGNNNITLQDGQLLTENMVMTADHDIMVQKCIANGRCDYKSEDRHVKTILKPRYVEEFTNPHFAKLKPGYEQITENYEYFYGPFSPYQSRNVLTINHYWARDWKFFQSEKLARVHLVSADFSEEEKKEKINNVIKCNEDSVKTYDGLIQRFVPALRAKVLDKKMSEN